MGTGEPHLAALAYLRRHCTSWSTTTPPTTDVKKWFAKNPRIFLRVTPTHISWMNVVESFFSITICQAIRRASFTSVREATDGIRTFIDACNYRCVPFIWTQTAEEILTVANRKAAMRSDGVVRDVTRSLSSGAGLDKPRGSVPNS